MQAGCEDVLLIEAQERPGGRIETVGYNGRYLDVGAQWIHSSKNELYKLSSNYELISSRVVEEGRGLYVREDGLVFDRFVVNKVDFIFGKVLEDCEKFKDSNDYPKSVGEYLNEKFREYLRDENLNEDTLRQYMELYDWNVRFQIVDNSCENLYQLSAKHWGDYVVENEDGQTHISYKKGIGSVIDTLVSMLPKNRIITNNPVENINWSNDTVLITTQNGKIEAEGVIVTSSLGVLKHSKTTLFTPPLPERTDRTIENMKFGGICKIFLEYPTPWWEGEVGFQILWKWDRGYGDDWTRYLSGFDLVHDQPNMLVGWVGGKGAQLVEKIPENTIGHNCTTLLRKFLKKQDVSYPLNVIR